MSSLSRDAISISNAVMLLVVICLAEGRLGSGPEPGVGREVPRNLDAGQLRGSV